MSTVKKFEKQPVIPDPPNTRTDTKSVFLQKADVFNPALKAWADSFNASVVDNLNALVDVLNQQLPYINTVSDADAAIRAVYTAIAQVNTVSSGIESVNACATWMDKIKLVAENMAEVVSAQGYAEEAKKWALIASAVGNVKPATKEALGLVKVGTGLNIDLEGTLDVAPDQISSTTAGGAITVKDVAIGGDLGDLASARGQIGTPPIQIFTKTSADDAATLNLNDDKWWVNGEYSLYLRSEFFPFTPVVNNTPLEVSGHYSARLRVANVYHTGNGIQEFSIAIGGRVIRMYYRTRFFNSDNTFSYYPWREAILTSNLGDGIRTINGIISVPEYEGATASAAGTSGLVPPATAGQQESFLTGGGEYKPALTKISDSVSLEDSTTAASATAVKTAYDLANSKQANLGFTPVQQGGGTGQGTNKIYIGWATDASGLKAQADSTNLGNIVTTAGGTIKAPQAALADRAEVANNATLADRAEVATNADKLGVSGWGYTSWNNTPYTVSPLYLWCLPTGGSDMQPCSPSVLSVYSTEVTPNVRVGHNGSVLPAGGTWRTIITSRVGEGTVMDLAGGSTVNASDGVFMAIRVA